MNKYETFKQELESIIRNDIDKAKARLSDNEMRGDREAIATDKGYINALTITLYDINDLSNRD